MRFEWDPLKARANVRTHGVTFAEAVTVLEDDFGLTRDDPAIAEESRFVTLGLSKPGQPTRGRLHLSRARRHPGHLGLEGEQTSKGDL